MKKILFVSINDHVIWGGSEVLWSEAALRIAKEDNVEVAFTVKKWPETPIHLQKLIDVGCVDLRWEEPIKKKKSLFERVVDKLTGADKRRKRALHFSMTALDKYNPTLVVISLGDHNVGFNWTNELRKRKIDYVLVPQLVKDAHIPDEVSERYKDLKKGYENAKMICCVSNDNLALLEKQFGLSFKNTTIVNNPIRSPKAPINYPESNVFNIACVASLNFNHKAQDVILGVMKNEKWQNRPIHINLYGNGPHKTLLLQLIEKWGVKNVSLEPFSEIDDIWSKNHMLLLPSRMEGLSLSLLEAFNFERTVLTTDLGDASRFIEDGITGYLLEFPTVKLLDAKLEQAWNNRDDWEKMGKLGKEKMLKSIKKDPVEAFSNTLLVI